MAKYDGLSETAKRSNEEIDRFIQDGRKRMDQFQSMYRDAIRYTFGDQIPKKRKKGWHYPVMNRMYADIMQEVAILSANNPRIDTPPFEDTDIEVAKTCGMVLKGLWSEVLKMRIKIIQALLDKHLASVMIGKWLWEPKAEWDEKKAAQTGNGWKGKIDVNVINPNYFGCDPDVELAVEIPEKARFVWTERWVSKQYAIQRWPKYKKYLKDKGLLDDIEEGGSDGGSGQLDESGFDRSDNSWSGREAEALDEETLQARLSDLILDDNERDSTGGHHKRNNKDLVRVQEVYNRDYSTERVEAMMEDFPIGVGDASNIFQIPGDPFFYDRDKPITPVDGDAEGIPVDQIEYEQFSGDWPKREVRPAYDRPKYPNGRLRIRVGEECIVHDEAWSYKRWPFAVGVHYLLPHMWMGANSVELSRGFQDWMNIIASHMTNYIKYFADPMWKIEEGALAKIKGKIRNVIPNWAGAVLRLNQGRINSAERVDPPNLPPTLFNMMEMFKGADQDLKGIHDVAQGKASSENTLGELEMLNRNTRQRVAMQGAMLDEWLKQIAMGVVELMQRNLRPGDWVRWTGDDPEAAKSAIAWTQEMSDARFDVILEPVSTLPYDEDREIAKYIKAYEIVGPAMLPDVLKKMKIQNLDEILMRHELLGPLTQLMEMTSQMGAGPDQLMMAIQQQLQLLQSMMAPAGGGGLFGGGGGGGVQLPGPQPPQGGGVDLNQLNQLMAEQGGGQQQGENRPPAPPPPGM